jgi:hypothetical protein
MKTRISAIHSSQETQISRIHTNVPISGPRLMPFVAIRAIPVFIAFAYCVGHCSPLLAAEEEVKYPSPDGRFALRISDADRKAELIEKASGAVIMDLGTASRSPVLVWSPDSKWVAYGNRWDKEGDVSVFLWNGSTFQEAPLPDDLPFPDIKFRKNVGSIRHYGAWLTPLKWLKPGELELSNEVLVLDRDSGADYTGVLQFTLAFDAQRHASVKKVGKTKTEVEE